VERKILLLGMLRGSSMYGYQINDMLDAHLGTSIELTRPSAYRFLAQMAEQGWVNFTEEKEGNRPTRRVYAITPAGETAFQEMLRDSLSTYAPTASNNTISIAFIEALPPEEATALLEKRRNLIAEMRNSLSLDDMHPGGLGYLILHQIRHMNTELDWLDEVIQKYGETRDSQ
jgi:DNA-binding PadR family transcriptional regulator